LLTARLTIELKHGQYFCETVKAYEVWESRNGLEYRVKRISKKSVRWWLKNEYDLNFVPSLYGKSGLARIWQRILADEKAFQKMLHQRKRLAEAHSARCMRFTELP